MPRKLRGGVIGCGIFGKMHLQVMKSLTDVDVAAICDKDGSVLNAAKSEYGIREAYSDYNEMLLRANLDFVSVCTPESLHTAPTIAAIEQGVGVLVEKPIATDLKEARAMIAAAQRQHVPMMVGHILRWDPRYATVKQMIDAGKLGRIAAIYARRTTFRRLASIYLMRVGVFPVLGIHDIDLLLWYTQDSVEECHAYGAPLLGFSYPDTAVCALSFKGGVRSVLTFSFATPEGPNAEIGNRIEIISEKAFTVIDTAQQTLQVTDSDGFHPKDVTFASTLDGRVSGALRDELRYFTDCVRDGTEVEMATPEEATNALKVALACQESAQRGTTVRIE